MKQFKKIEDFKNLKDDSIKNLSFEKEENDLEKLKNSFEEWAKEREENESDLRNRGHNQDKIDDLFGGSKIEKAIEEFPKLFLPKNAIESAGGINNIKSYESKKGYTVFEEKDDLSNPIVLLFRFEQKEETPNSLYVASFNGRPGEGIASEFFKETLPYILKKLGFKYIIGYNDNENLPFFTEKIGRIKASDLKEGQNIVPAHAKNLDFVTVQFLYEEDKKEWTKND